MTDSPSEEILRPYRDAVARYGPGFEATLWGSRDAQRLRFQIMIDLARPEGCTVLDVGCGHGDFAAEMLSCRCAYSRYHGLDALPEVIEAARARNLPRCSFDVVDVVAAPGAIDAVMPALGGSADYICISGTLNTMDDHTARNLVRASFESAAQGVVFNFLSNRPHTRWGGRDLTPARRFDTLGWLDWAMSISSRVSFTQEYLDGHDATIMIRHDTPGP